ncbi:hypothetical protein Daesc_007393 [Daldinia eschscholtzii]|uniref:Uncharacterized protein n=1 Tax=Daldinia eschscholtzii TaxID=292717 RepID=A0AAX6ME28_9PEZI
MKFSVAALAFAAGASASYPVPGEQYPVSSETAPGYPVETPSAPASSYPVSSAPVSSYPATSSSAPASSYPASSESASYPASSSGPASYPGVSSSASTPAEYPVVSSSATVPSYPVETPSNSTSATQYTTEVVTSYETYCPGPTQITYGTNTYTVTEPTTLTITDCPCTISKPIYTTSSVSCATCAPAPSYPVQTPPSYPTTAPAPPSYPNNTAPVNTPSQPYPTGGAPAPSYPATPIPTAGAGKAAAISGAGLVGLLGLAAALL